MAREHGVAGEWARVKGTVIGLLPLFLGVFVCGFALATMLVSALLGAIFLVLAVMFSGWMLVKGLHRVESFYKGARGEERVAGILKTLPDAYRVFNDFVACGRHVDHVVVGPAGVFAIETKYWNGKVTIEDGYILLSGKLPDRSPIAQVLREADAVREELAKGGFVGVVTPVLAFASDTFEAKIAEYRGAVILNSSHLRESFDTERVVLPPAELERLVRLMENER